MPRRGCWVGVFGDGVHVDFPQPAGRRCRLGSTGFFSVGPRGRGIVSVGIDDGFGWGGRGDSDTGVGSIDSGVMSEDFAEEFLVGFGPWQGGWEAVLLFLRRLPCGDVFLERRIGYRSPQVGERKLDLICQRRQSVL